jgi:hypothetical protein
VATGNSEGIVKRLEILVLSTSWKIRSEALILKIIVRNKEGNMVLQLKSGLKEIWAPFYIYDIMSEYDVSTYGRVRIRRTKQIRKPHLTHDGYLRMKLCFGGWCKMFTVHRMVALTFIPNDDPSNDTVNHKDDDKTNNHYDNLEWMTRSLNTKLSYKNGRGVGINHNMVKYSEKEIHQVCKMLTETDNRQYISKITGVTLTVIRDIHIGKTWTHISKDYNLKPSRDYQGEDHQSAKINKETVIKICELIDKGKTQSQIAKILDVPASTVGNIKLLAAWKSISKDYNFYKDRLKMLEAKRTMVSNIITNF